MKSLATPLDLSLNNLEMSYMYSRCRIRHTMVTFNDIPVFTRHLNFAGRVFRCLISLIS